MYLPIKNKSIILGHLTLLVLVLNGCSYMDGWKKEIMTNRVIARELPIVDADMNAKLKQGIIDSVLESNTEYNKKLMMARNEQIDIVLRMSNDNYNDFKNS